MVIGRLGHRPPMVTGRLGHRPPMVTGRLGHRPTIPVGYRGQKSAKDSRLPTLVADAYMCLGTMPVNDAERSDAVATNSLAIRDRTNDKKEEEVEEIRKLRREVQKLRLEVEEIKEELYKLKNDKKETKRAEESREISTGDSPGDIKITKTFSAPANSYMTFMPFQPSLSHGYLSYMYEI